MKCPYCNYEDTKVVDSRPVEDGLATRRRRECTKCGKKFEELVKVYTDKVPCPDCGGETERDYAGTMYSSTGKTSQKCSGNCKTCSGCR